MVKAKTANWFILSQLVGKHKGIHQGCWQTPLTQIQARSIKSSNRPRQDIDLGHPCACRCVKSVRLATHFSSVHVTSDVTSYSEIIPSAAIDIAIMSAEMSLVLDRVTSTLLASLSQWTIVPHCVTLITILSALNAQYSNIVWVCVYLCSGEIYNVGLDLNDHFSAAVSTYWLSLCELNMSSDVNSNDVLSDMQRRTDLCTDVQPLVWRTGNLTRQRNG